MHLLPSNALIHMIRLRPHEDLKQSLLAFARERQLKAAIILTCVGSLEQFHLRFANQKTGTKHTGHFEIISCSGTLSETSCHLHLCIADAEGKTTGGHLLDDNLIYTTAEIAIADLPEMVFERVPDPTYGYAELVIRDRRPAS